VLVTVPLENALLIPQKSTFEILDKKYVYVIDEENVVHSREITILAEIPHLFAISDGLKENERILLEGLRMVRENDEIEVEFVEPATAVSQLELYAE
jgi:membrane fusion protein (multidrug efflux system)